MLYSPNAAANVLIKLTVEIDVVCFLFFRKFITYSLFPYCKTIYGSKK